MEEELKNEEQAEEPTEDPKVCVNCRSHFPPDAPLIIPVAKPPVNGQQQAVYAVLCMCPDSKNFQQVMGINGTCGNHEMAPPPPEPSRIVRATTIPKKIRKRFTN